MTPDYSDLLAEADHAHQRGDLDIAERLCLEALEVAHGDKTPLFLLGVIYWKQGRYDSSVDCLCKFASAYPAFPPGLTWYSAALRSSGRLQEAQAAATRSLQLEPKNGQTLIQLGFCLLDQELFLEAASCFRKAVAADPKSEIAYRGLGVAYRGAGKAAQATAALRKAVEYGPQSLPSHIELLHSLNDEFNPKAAIECAKAIRRLKPGWAQAEIWLAKALLEDNKPAEAEFHAREAIKWDPNDGFAYCLLGWVHQATGEFQLAEQDFSLSIELEPNQGYAYASLACARRTGDLGPGFLDQMHAVVEARELADPHACQMQFALGRAYEDRNEFELAFHHYDLANDLAYSLNLGSKVFDSEAYAHGIDVTIRTFSREFIDRHRDASSSSDRPIFVMGMMRSGTTLVAQVLSAHPQVESGGELRFWAENANEAWSTLGESLDAAKLRKLESSYLAELDQVSNEAMHVVNKLPGNYLALGLIHIAFPNAKIVHVRRNPIDTCLSIYTMNNPTRSEWAHRKEAIAFAYREYRRIMAHWEKVLPPDSVFEVCYEDLVTDRDNATRRLIEFCGLEWHDDCLYPEKNAQAVMTPSVWQVRQSVYQTSVSRWKRFEPWLGPFAALASE